MEQGLHMGKSSTGMKQLVNTCQLAIDNDYMYYFLRNMDIDFDATKTVQFGDAAKLSRSELKRTNKNFQRSK